jgi:tRNA threonylcarbamoyladenosine biosynthesis protein TsaE
MYLADETATVGFGRLLGQALMANMVVFLRGELGAGKTTLVRGVVGALGHSGAVKSPTYTLVEPYEFADVTVYHFDLYRLADPEELEYIGIRDYFGPNGISLIEWDERGAGMLPEPDIIIELQRSDEGRDVTMLPCSDKGRQVVGRLQERV